MCLLSSSRSLNSKRLFDDVPVPVYENFLYIRAFAVQFRTHSIHKS